MCVCERAHLYACACPYLSIPSTSGKAAFCQSRESQPSLYVCVVRLCELLVQLTVDMCVCVCVCVCVVCVWCVWCVCVCACVCVQNGRLKAMCSWRRLKNQAVSCEVSSLLPLNMLFGA